MGTVELFFPRPPSTPGNRYHLGGVEDPPFLARRLGILTRLVATRCCVWTLRLRIASSLFQRLVST